jgi:O-antigen ligase
MKVFLVLMEVFIFSLPFQWALAPVSGVDLPFSRVFSIALFAIFLAVGLSRRKLMIPVSRETVLLSAFLCVSVLTILWAENGAWAVRRALFIVGYFPLFMVYSSIFSEYPLAVSRFVRAFVMGAGISAAVGILEFFSQFVFGVPVIFRFWTEGVLPIFLGSSFSTAVTQYPSLLVGIGNQTVLRVSSLFPDSHMAAFYFGLALPFSFVLTMGADRAGKKALYGMLSAMILFADVLTFSRGGYVGLGFGLAYLSVRYLRRVSDSGKRTIVPITLVCVFLIAALSSGPVRERVWSSLSPNEGSNRGRLEMYAEAVRRIAERPFGYGLGNYPLVVKPTADYREPIYAHDQYLDIATESGIIGASLFLLVIGTAFMSLSRSHSRVAAAGAAAVAIFFGHSLFESPMYSVHILPVLLMILALPAAKGTEGAANVSTAVDPSESLIV